MGAWDQGGCPTLSLSLSLSALGAIAPEDQTRAGMSARSDKDRNYVDEAHSSASNNSRSTDMAPAVMIRTSIGRVPSSLRPGGESKSGNMAMNGPCGQAEQNSHTSHARYQGGVVPQWSVVRI